MQAKFTEHLLFPCKALRMQERGQVSITQVIKSGVVLYGDVITVEESWSKGALSGLDGVLEMVSKISTFKGRGHFEVFHLEG